MQRVWLSLVGFLLVSGCLGGGTDAPAPPGSTGANSEAALACDHSIFPGIRGREVDVAVDPNNRSRVAAVAMVSIPSTRQAAPADLAVWTGLARSFDGGQTWTHIDLPNFPGDLEQPNGPFTGVAVLGDGIVGFLPNGDLLLTGIFIYGALQYNMFAARFPGDSFELTDFSVFSRGGWGDAALNDIPSFNPIAYNDKQDMAIDPETGGVYVSWMWRSNLRGTTSVPVVSYSPDGGRTWQAPVMLIDALGAGLTSDDFHAGAVPFLLGDQVHVVWWQSGTGAVLQASAPRGTLDFGAAREIAQLGGDAGSGNSVLTLAIPQVAVGPRPDGTGERVWLTAIRAGDGYDVGLWHSDDAVTWTGPINPALDTAQDQLLPTVAVDASGRVAVQYIDRSEDPSNSWYHAVTSVSTDGQTFRVHRMSAQPTNAFWAGDEAQGHVGDYMGNAFTSAGLLGAWQDGRTGTDLQGYSEIYACLVAV